MNNFSARIILRTGKVDSVRRRHPWIFSGAIKRIEGNPASGDLVEVYDNHENFLAIGHYGTSSIAVRIISFVQQQINQEFWNQKIASAWNYRHMLGLTQNENTTAFRLIHGEGDGLPGLIIDYYNGVAVVEFHSPGMENAQDMISVALREVIGSPLKNIYTLSKSKSDLFNRYLMDEKIEVPHCFRENGINFEVDWEQGQKTGFFLDQRENRASVLPYVKGKKVLNMFCYTGGFSVYAAVGGAAEVVSVDVSAKAIEQCKRNLGINGIDPGKNPCIASDAMEYLKSMPEGYFDMIILDPPAYAKHTDSKHNAIQGYKRLNEAASSKIKNGGILFTYSCSQVVERMHFQAAVMGGILQSGRDARIMHHFSQAPCHPQSLYHQEGFYLKGLALEITGKVSE